jgi:hypothetical protein
MTGATLRRALQANRTEIQRGIAEAEAELAACERSCDELRALIQQARAALGDPLVDGRPRRSLREAMELVLTDAGGGPVRAYDILRQVRDHDLYRTKAGKAPSLNQIHARVYHAPNRFERTKKGIRLREAQSPEDAGD